MYDTIKSTKTAPERYRKGTGKVLNSGDKGTGEVLKSYQIDTNEVLTASRSVVAHDSDSGELEKGGGAISFGSSAFKERCGAQIAKDVSVFVKRKTRAQKGLKEVDGFAEFLDISIPPSTGAYSRCYDTKRLKTCGLRFIAIMIFCVLFSRRAACLGQEISS